jgi:proprotein convertase subtilisin/kexin type 5
MINTEDCLEKKIDNSHYVYEEFLIISCNENYTYTNGQCEFNCYSSCETCLEKSIDDTNQKCITCKSSFPFLYNNNCLDICPDKTYENNYKCIDCDESCFSCDITGCKNCYEGFYVNNDSHICEQCHENCQTCYNGGNAINNNCIKCKNESDTLLDGTCLKNCGEKHYRTLYNTCEQCHENCSTCLIGGDDKNNNCSSCINDLYLIKGGEYENNCVENCPENYSKNDTEKICTYIKPSDNNDNIDSSDETESWLWYVITITAILLLIINIIFFSKNCCCKDKEDDIVENIQTELSDISGNNIAIN